MSKKISLFDQVGGLPTLDRVHKRFYDKMYAHPWLGKFFEGHDQQAIELRQTQFMGVKMGGAMRYPGMALELAHRRMYITLEQLELRQSILRESLEEEHVPEPLIKRWLKIDAAFWGHIKNDSLEEFQQVDLKYERPLIVPNPDA
ncbi:group I truncated hemoglobin [Mariprofundus ferrooxydans]|uniref:Bacterial-like globin n=1 Tax=Mariprofundus ferrooxydans PV-1 TaxID=314345 RepID=Q0EZX3_9PROT|nr:group 1 truncated hemoglobin [Mariprofundus ferrooxydans]EAU54911.1 Bacterial-like globin [Mariprofundus ferrooxydans PV-1]KON46782.1 globin [Mariprofundus ferrooxydans]